MHINLHVGRPLALMLLALIACHARGDVASTAHSTVQGEAFLIADSDRLREARRRVFAGDPALQDAVRLVTKFADEALDTPTRSVADKDAMPPSGDKNDYVSLSPYFWPNPETDDGLPYIRKDGQINPERDRYDMPALDAFGKSVRRLGFGYYFTGDERYAQDAARRLQHFLVDPATRMNPRMLHGQFVPGVTDGRKYGIIETLRLRWIPEAVIMLEGSPAMTPELSSAIRQWFADYAHWLNTSELGTAERDGNNNHATWCKAQIAYYSAFAGDLDTTRQMVELARDHLADHFAADGSQPVELKRTKALDYSEFNLRAHTELAVLGDLVGVDLWNATTAEGSGIRKGLEFLLPYINGEKQWPYQQIIPPKQDFYPQTLRRCAIAYNDPRYEAAIDAFEFPEESRVYIDLIIPLPDGFPKHLSN